MAQHNGPKCSSSQQPKADTVSDPIYQRLYDALRQHAAARVPHIRGVRFQVEGFVRTQCEPALARTIVERGTLRDGSNVELHVMERSECHMNTLALTALSGGRLEGETGFALSDDGVWRVHSWAYDPALERVIETTTPRVLYVGRPMIEDTRMRQLVNVTHLLMDLNRSVVV